MTFAMLMLPRNALKRDSNNLKAYIRAGNAQLGLQQPQVAADMFRQALLLDAANTAAQVYTT